MNSAVAGYAVLNSGDKGREEPQPQEKKEPEKQPEQDDKGFYLTIFKYAALAFIVGFLFVQNVELGAQVDELQQSMYGTTHGYVEPVPNNSVIAAARDGRTAYDFLNTHPVADTDAITKYVKDLWLADLEDEVYEGYVDEIPKLPVCVMERLGNLNGLVARVKPNALQLKENYDTNTSFVYEFEQKETKINCYRVAISEQFGAEALVPLTCAEVCQVKNGEAVSSPFPEGGRL